jgi:hypothetical protein
MKHLSLLGWLSLVFILSTALTCTDHRDLPPAARFRVKTVTYFYGIPYQSSRTISLTYGDNGKISNYSGPSDSFLPEALKSERVSYTNNLVSRLTVFTGKFTYYYTTYSYDSQDRLSQMNYFYNAEVKPRLVHDFTYNGNSMQPTSRIATVISSTDGTVLASKTETYTFSGGNATSINGNSYTYDTSPNPYKGLLGFSAWGTYITSPDAYYDSSTNTYGVDRPFAASEPFSDSSVKVFNQNNRTTDAQLTYNSDGLVTKIVYKDGKSEAFTYESY